MKRTNRLLLLVAAKLLVLLFFQVTAFTTFDTAKDNKAAFSDRVDFSVDPTSLNVTLPVGETDTVNLLVTNTGDSLLTFTPFAVEEMESGSSVTNHVYGDYHFKSLERGSTDTRKGIPVTAGKGGPDLFGYRWMDSDETGGPVYQWNDISATGQRLDIVSECLDCSQMQSISFTFPFYENSYDEIYVGSNGYITLGSGSNIFVNYPLPSTMAPPNLIAPLYEDLYPGWSGDIYFQDFGNYVIVQYNNVGRWSGPGTYTFQLKLDNNGVITYYYNNLSGTLLSNTVGIQNATQDDGLTIAYNTSYLKENFAIEIRSTPKWLSVANQTITLDPGESYSLLLEFNAQEVYGDHYYGALEINHNSSLKENPFIIPCTLYAQGFRGLSVSPLSHQFESTWAGGSDTALFTLTNAGDETTAIDSIVTNNEIFSVSSQPSTVPAFGTVQFMAIFSPENPINNEGTLEIYSNAEDNPYIAVSLSGIGTEPPVASIEPRELYASSLPNSAPVDRTFVLSNSGAAPLTFAVKSIVETSTPLMSLKSSPQPPTIKHDKIYCESNYKNPFVPGRVIVGLKEQADNFSNSSILSSIDATNVRDLTVFRNQQTSQRVPVGRRILLVELKTKTEDSVHRAISILKTDPNVAYAEPDFIVSIDRTPNDELFDQLYSMHNTGQTGGTPNADISALGAWQKHVGNGSILIGVIDTGIDYLHPDIADNMWTNPGETPNGEDDDGNGYIDDIHGYDFAYGTSDPMDRNGHGTHCAGTIAAVGDNNIGVVGVMWDAQLVALKFLNDGGGGSTSGAIEAVNYATMMDIDITSNSWGGGGFSQGLKDAIAAGGLFIAAAGNSSENKDIFPSYPASYNLDNIISVAATDHNDNLAWFSCYGPNSVHLGAPGVDILSTVPNNSYDHYSGTSMATPHVAGVAGLIWSFNPSLTALEVKQIILDNVDPIPSLQGMTITGGRLNAQRAIEATPAPWITVESMEPGVLNPNEEQEFVATLDPQGLVAGEWSALVLMETNDPLRTEDTVFVTLDVQECKSLSANKDSIGFGEIAAGSEVTDTVELSNTCNADLTVSEIVFENEYYGTDLSFPILVPAYGSTNVAITYSPSSVGNHVSSMTIISDADDNPEIIISLEGTALDPPSAIISPRTLDFSFSPPDMAPADRTFTLSNNGGLELTYDIIEIREISTPLRLSQSVQSLPKINSEKIYNSRNYENEFMPGRIIVGFNRGKSSFADNILMNRLNIESVRELTAFIDPKTNQQILEDRRIFLYELQDDSPQAVLDAIAILKNDANVAYAEPDYIVSIDNLPNDPEFNRLYGLHNTGQTGGTSGADISALSAWQTHTGNGSVLIGVIDTGIDYLHPDLADNIWTNPGETPNGEDDDGNGYIDDIHGYDFAYRTSDPMDRQSHGTHCAGTIAAVGDNSIGVTGVMWNAQLVALKFLNDSGSGSTADAIEAVNYSTAMDIKITSNSWGGGGFSQGLKDAISQSGLFVAAAGNNGRNTDFTPFYPACYDLPNIINVAATNHNDALASFSNYGQNTVHLGAPGVSIYSTEPNNRYGYKSGTSMAAPHVSGVAGLIWSYNPSLTALEVKDILLDNVDPIASLDGLTITGGRLNAQKAIEATVSPWLTVAPDEPGTVSPGEHQDFTVTVDPYGLAAGEWRGEIVMSTNDPLKPLDTVTVIADIEPCRSITLSTDTLQFGTVYTGQDSSLNVDLTNNCNNSVQIDSIVMDSEYFSFDESFPLTIPAFSSIELSVQFAPESEGVFYEYLHIFSDADNNPELILTLQGIAELPPEMTLFPNAFERYASPGQIIEDTLFIVNDGGSVLDWYISGVSDTTAQATHFYDASHFIKFDKGEEDLREGYPLPNNSGGPDLFGYTWIDSDEPGGPVYNWREIKNTGTRLTTVSGCDDCSQVQTIPFSFPFYGTEYDRIFVSSNGFITFGSGSGQYVNYPIPSINNPARLIAPFFDDINPRAMGNIYYQANSDSVIVQFENCARYGGNGVYTFQVILLKNGDIVYQYKDMSGFLNRATVGIQNEARNDGLEIVYNAPYVKNNHAVKISLIPEWATVSQLSGQTEAGDTSRVILRLNATDLDPSVYTTELNVYHNVPGDESSIIVPITLTVSEDIIEPPQIISHPEDLTVEENDTAWFEISAQGTDLSYQWQKDGENIDGANDAFLMVPNVDRIDDGATFRCIVSNSAGTVISNEAQLTVIVPSNYGLFITAIGSSAEPELVGSQFRLEEVNIGSVSSGKVSGNRFNLFLR
ncbi:S8 family serine peptidase [Chitinispirillales bacterium ANBcel5]|uniref:S8 family serine peptidase n=1 Tax=Cellulosispirillum alkaliphilum TaxID=3039283 RepID=UPI002A51C149|nr:S8 family serine peptidase [Chitinispirillales bacterium ANBcel5]